MQRGCTEQDVSTGEGEIDEERAPTTSVPPVQRTAQVLRHEFRTLVADRAPLVRSRVGGRRGFHELQLKARGLETMRSPVWWAYLAQIGSLDKFDTVLARDGDYETFELLAIARNLLENHIWLRLLRADVNYGLVFYARFLTEQIQNHDAYLAKLRGEAELFESMEDLERDINSVTIARAKASPAPSPEDLADISAERNERLRELDDMVRREFSLFAEQATYNGYSYQAAILRRRAIPAYEAERLKAHAEREALFADLPALLDPKLLKLATGGASQWNWRARAVEAHLGRRYDFLYGYTSRLLHATPLNLVTEKALSELEARIILDYIVVVGADILDEIEAFAPQGQVDAVAIDLGCED